MREELLRSPFPRVTSAFSQPRALAATFSFHTALAVAYNKDVLCEDQTPRETSGPFGRPWAALAAARADRRHHPQHAHVPCDRAGVARLALLPARADGTPTSRAPPRDGYA
jgi:hypothetical protein